MPATISYGFIIPIPPSPTLKIKTKKSKNQLTLVSGCSIIIMELGDANLLDKLFYSCETKPYLISAYIGNNPVRFPYRVYIGRTVS